MEETDLDNLPNELYIMIKNGQSTKFINNKNIKLDYNKQ